MQLFAKLFEVKDTQVLIVLSKDEETEAPQIIITTEKDEIRGVVKFTFGSQELADKEFARYDQASAEQVYGIVVGMLGEKQ